MKRIVAFCALMASVSLGCRTTFHVYPGELPLDRTMRTTSGEVVPVPRDYRATLEPATGMRLMTPEDLNEVRAYPVPHDQVDLAESAGWTARPIVFADSRTDRRDGELIVRDVHDRTVHVPMAVVKRVQVVDEAARKGNKAAAIAIPTTLGGGALVAVVIAVVVALSSAR